MGCIGQMTRAFTVAIRLPFVEVGKPNERGVANIRALRFGPASRLADYRKRIVADPLVVRGGAGDIVAVRRRCKVGVSELIYHIDVKQTIRIDIRHHHPG